MKDKDFEGNILNLLNRLYEQDLGTEASGEEEDWSTANIAKPGLSSMRDAPGADIGGQQTDDEVQEQPGKSFQFLDTKTMFTTDPPSGSDTWSESKKKMYKPLHNGTLHGKLAKFFKSKSDSRIKYLDSLKLNAARYNTHQFRMTFGAKFKMDADIKLIITREGVKARLVRLFANTPFQKSNVTFEDKDLQPLGDIEIGGVRTDKFFQRKKEESKIAYNLKYLTDNKIKNIDNIDKNILDESMKIVNDIINYYKENRVKINYDPENDSHISRLISIANYTIENDVTDIDNLLLSEFGTVNENRDEYKIDLNSYLKKILVEADAPGEEAKKERGGKSGKLKKDVRGTLEDELGGDIISKINKKLIPKWFGGGNGITAAGRPPYFDNKMFQFFQTLEVSFIPQKKSEVKKSEDKSSKAEMTVSGYFDAVGYIWLDARISEQGGPDSWTFRIYDNPQKPFLRLNFSLFGGTASIKIRKFAKGQNRCIQIIMLVLDLNKKMIWIDIKN